MEDSNKCAYRVQVDTLVLEAHVAAQNGGRHDATIQLHFYTEDDPSDGLDAIISKGQLLAMLQLLQSMWSQIGGHAYYLRSGGG